MYIRSVYKRVEPTKFEIVGFADDHQLIKQFIIQLTVTSLGEDIRNCLDVIGEWMSEAIKINRYPQGKSRRVSF